MSDQEYDLLLKELESLEEEHPEHDDPNSPTRRVGGEPVEGFRTVRHSVPMLSIDNTYNEDEVRQWVRRTLKSLGAEDPKAARKKIEADGAALFVADPKIDGVAITLRYERGAFTRAVTRGDGERGDDVTTHVRTIRAVPLSLDASDLPEGVDMPGVLEVRGEVYMPIKSFERLNEQREKEDKEPFMNPRNACAGTLKQLNPKVVAERGLSFVAHGAGEISPEDAVGCYSRLLEVVEALGMPVNQGWRRCDELDDVLHAIEEFSSLRQKAPYAVDGAVVRVDDFSLQRRLGTTAKAPRWCIAYKYPAERKQTKLIEVDVHVGKTGKITPRAIMDPVRLAGTIVRHATLHNFGEVRRKDIRVGDTVVVEKAGEIIPQVIEPVKEKRPARTHPIRAPRQCPRCGGPVELEPPELEEAGDYTSEKETARRCVNPECPAQIREKLIWFAGRSQMDIDGLGEKTIDQIREESDIPLDSFADVYRLKDHRDELLELERMGEKKLENLLNSIEESKDRGLARLLGSLGVRHLGSATARALCQRFKDIDELLDADEPLLRPKAMSREEAEKHAFDKDPKNRPSTGLGRDTAPVIYNYLHSDAGRKTIRELRDLGVDMTSREYRRAEQAGTSPFAGKKVVLTGSLESFKRTELTELLERLGADVTSSVSKNTDLLIAGESPGSKYDNAKKHDVEIWDEKTLLKNLPEDLRPG
jgi:DNA ligase (NAD+)